MNSSVAVEWKAVCKVSDVLPGTGVGVRLPAGQAALFCTRDGQFYALDNLDPFSHANVLSRGILGSIGDRKVVASPIYKQHFDLETGQCIEDETVSLNVYPVRVEGDVIEVAMSAAH
ncbi:MAG: nitrite reductase (NAD(P)H) small subunit [Alcanivoracaceae bacterium]|uniref:nitrite reductase small subunit NirD n=1 Tax=Alcanivorax sp. MD8A TaxID=1177157 RepID=UPI000C49E558|nr:nitrite reductase small subunit NirD [Alcanivorax sp. MD8A]MAX56607.1 nitrite reductase (NAD(P)H) small subunit [Alcanivoracaceae bacterium]MCG8439921.1 nitrite reductase small subunit NirD [Pseudomonadales bacterium]MED5432970.1 nitrite reductase small subunit NirD [Pseudomonadota bacterium]MEE2869788.1 nitrite reductase small subunit NirD [Pseudomonadota bacterium]PNE02550.1 nitrite reductase small subunit [Alcanivorax sp. MD8A]|tara:strand:- start:2247 stop:2597 length:351 start_codon:yes stop_codon:yes gene_type:complete